MSILTTYSQFRTIFATSTTVGNDGYYVWPVANVNSVSGFVDTITVSLVQSTPDYFLVTVDATADASFHAHRYDWYVSQGTDDSDYQMFSASRFSLEVAGVMYYYSGALRLDVNSSMLAAVAPDASVNDLSDLSLHQIILNNVHVYCQRKSDDAIQWVDLRSASLSSRY